MSICAQVQVCQIPKSLCRIAGRPGKRAALRTSNFGNVSSRASTAFSSGAQASRPHVSLGGRAGPPALLMQRLAGSQVNHDVEYPAVVIFSKKKRTFFGSLEQVI